MSSLSQNQGRNRAAMLEKKLKKDTNILTDAELQIYNVTTDTLHKIKCNLFNNLNDKEKEKLKNTFIANSDSGLYEYLAKNVECLKEESNNNKRLYEGLNIDRSNSDENTIDEIMRKKKYYKAVEYDNFKKIKKICTSKASELCNLPTFREDMSKDDRAKIQIKLDSEIEKLKKIKYDELGPNRRLKLYLRGFKYENNEWKKDEDLYKKFTNAVEICNNDKHCMDKGSSIEDIPVDTSEFVNLLVEGVGTPLRGMLSIADSMKDNRTNIAEVKAEVAKRKLKKLDEKEQKKLEKQEKAVEKMAASQEKKLKKLENKEIAEKVKESKKQIKEAEKDKKGEAKAAAKAAAKEQRSESIKAIKEKYKTMKSPQKNPKENMLNERKKAISKELNKLKEQPKSRFSKTGRRDLEKQIKSIDKVNAINESLDKTRVLRDTSKKLAESSSKYDQAKRNVKDSENKLKRLNELSNTAKGEIKEDYKRQIQAEKQRLSEFNSEKDSAKTTRDVLRTNYNSKSKELYDTRGNMGTKAGIAMRELTRYKRQALENTGALTPNNPFKQTKKQLKPALEKARERAEKYTEGTEAFVNRTKKKLQTKEAAISRKNYKLTKKMNEGLTKRFGSYGKGNERMTKRLGRIQNAMGQIEQQRAAERREEKLEQERQNLENNPELIQKRLQEISQRKKAEDAKIAAAQKAEQDAKAAEERERKLQIQKEEYIQYILDNT